MPVHFTCPHCAQLLSVARRKVGSVVQCVSCLGGVMVPPPSAEQDGWDVAPDRVNVDFPTDIDDEGIIEAPEYPVLEQELAGLEAISTNTESPRPVVQTHVWSGTIPITRIALYSIGGLIVGVALASFVLGWAMGRGTLQNQGAATANVRHRIYGRVMYTTGSGRLAADTKSVVVALPRRKKPDEKLGVHSLRPEKVSLPTGQDPTVRAIRSIGGDFGLTNRSGDYELEVSEPGEYYLLILSSHLARPVNRPPVTTEIVELGQYFRQANVLLGKNDYVWTKHPVRTDKKFDHLFGEDD